MKIPTTLYGDPKSAIGRPPPTTPQVSGDPRSAMGQQPMSGTPPFMKPARPGFAQPMQNTFAPDQSLPWEGQSAMEAAPSMGGGLISGGAGMAPPPPSGFPLGMGGPMAGGGEQVQDMMQRISPGGLQGMSPAAPAPMGAASGGRQALAALLTRRGQV